MSVTTATPPPTRRRSRITQSEVTRALKAAVAAGITIGSFEIREDGSLVVRAKGEEQDGTDILDLELKKFRKQHGTG